MGDLGRGGGVVTFTVVSRVGVGSTCFCFGDGWADILFRGGQLPLKRISGGCGGVVTFTSFSRVVDF